MKRRLTALIAAGAFLAPASAKAADHERVAFLRGSERTWSLKASYWETKRAQARRWKLSHGRRAYVVDMLRSRRWHRAKRARQLDWHLSKAPAPIKAHMGHAGVLPAPPSIVPLGHELQAEGYMVGEHPAFGGVAPVHVPNSRHYIGQALDINADGRPGGEASWLDRLAPRLRALGWFVIWRAPGHFDHLHVQY